MSFPRKKRLLDGAQYNTWRKADDCGQKPEIPAKYRRHDGKGLLYAGTGGKTQLIAIFLGQGGHILGTVARKPPELRSIAPILRTISGVIRLTAALSEWDKAVTEALPVQPISAGWRESAGRESRTCLSFTWAIDRESNRFDERIR